MTRHTPPPYLTACNTIYAEERPGRVKFHAIIKGPYGHSRSANLIATAAFLAHAGNCHAELMEAAKAAVAYDQAIESCGNNPNGMASFCTAEGADLDALYLDWRTKARAALAKARSE